MNVTAHRSMAMALSIQNPQPVPPVDPNGPGPRPPPKHLSARALTALVSQLTTGYSNPDSPEDTPGPLDPYIRKALERSVIGSGVGTNLWRVIAEKHPEIWDVIGGDPASTGGDESAAPAAPVRVPGSHHPGSHPAHDRSV